MERGRVLNICGALLLAIGILSSSSCVKVPVQAVVLSRTVGERLPEIETSHEAFVSAYFQASRDRVQDFINEKWIPTFLGKFVAKSNLMQQLKDIKSLTDEQNSRLQTALQNAGVSGSDQPKVVQAVNDAFGDPDRGKLVLLFSESALKQIEQERRSLLDPLDEQERTTLSELRKIYAQVEQAQATVTAHLASIQKVTDEQDQVLTRLNLLKTRDDVVEKALDTNRKIKGILDAGAGAEETFNQLGAALKQ